LSVTVQFEHALGDIDVTLHDAAGNQLAASTSTSNTESMTYGVTAGQPYYIRVYGYNGATNPSYSLTVDGPNVVADAFEPNDTSATATNLVSVPTLVANATIHQSQNDDWYRVTPATRARLTVDASFVNSQGDVNLALYDAHLNLLASSVSTTDQEQVSAIVRAGHSYYIKAYGQRATYSNRRLLGPPLPVYDGALSSEYDLHVGLQPCSEGDIDCSGRVDLVDVALLQLSQGATGFTTLADLDGNGLVDRHDAAIVARDYGRTLPPGAAPAALLAIRQTPAARRLSDAVAVRATTRSAGGDSIDKTPLRATLHARRTGRIPLEQIRRLDAAIDTFLVNQCRT
jgi:hypothetical protein